MRSMEWCYCILIGSFLGCILALIVIGFMGCDDPVTVQTEGKGVERLYLPIGYTQSEINLNSSSGRMVELNKLYRHMDTIRVNSGWYDTQIRVTQSQIRIIREIRHEQDAHYPGEATKRE